MIPEGLRSGGRRRGTPEGASAPKAGDGSDSGAAEHVASPGKTPATTVLSASAIRWSVPVNEDPRCGLIIPTSSGIAFLPLAVASLRMHRIEDADVLIVDNAWTDGTEDGLAAEAARDPRVIRSKPSLRRRSGSTRLGPMSASATPIAFKSARVETFEERPSTLGRRATSIDGHTISRWPRTQSWSPSRSTVPGPRRSSLRGTRCKKRMASLPRKFLACKGG